MEDRKKYIDQIPDYLDDLLTAGEKAAFEKRLQEDAVLGRELELQYQVIHSLGDAEQRDFRKILEDFNRQTPVSDRGIDPPKSRSVFRLVGIAAAVLLLLGALVWIIFPTPSTSQLLAAYIDQIEAADVLPPDDIARSQRGDSREPVAGVGESKDAAWQQARQLFRQERYTEALAAFEAIEPAVLPRKDAFFFEKGVLYLLNDRPGPAIEFLQQVEPGFNPYATRWYLALAYLQLDQSDRGKSQLLLLLDRSNPWQDKARELLDSL